MPLPELGEGAPDSRISFFNQTIGLRFNSRNDALDFAKHTVKDAQRWFATECPRAYQDFRTELENDAASYRRWFEFQTWLEAARRLIKII